MRGGIPDHVYPFYFQSECQVSRTTAQIEDAGIGAAQDATKFFRREAAPLVIQRERQQVVQQVVSRRNSAEHIADAPRGIAFVTSAFRPRTKHRGRRCLEDFHTLCNSVDLVPLRCQPSSNPGSERKLAPTARHGTATPHFVFPITEGNTQPISPACTFLSLSINDLNSEFESDGMRGSGPTDRIRPIIRAASFTPKWPMASASSVAIIIPWPTASPWRNFLYPVAVSSAWPSVWPKFKIWRSPLSRSSLPTTIALIRIHRGITYSSAARSRRRRASMFRSR